MTLTAGLDGMGALRTVDPTPTLADAASGQPLYGMTRTSRLGGVARSVSFKVG